MHIAVADHCQGGGRGSFVETRSWGASSKQEEMQIKLEQVSAAKDA